MSAKHCAMCSCCVKVGGQLSPILIAATRTIFHAHIFVTHNSFTHIFVTHHLSHTTLSRTIFHIQLFKRSILHLFCLSFLSRPAGTFVSACWKKLTCGVIRSINFAIKGSLEPKLPTICTVGKEEVGRAREEKRRREKIREEKQ